MSGMAEVLAGHFMVGLAYTEDQATSFDICKCGERANDIEQHQTAMLTAAGFGPVKEAGAAALEEAADAWREYLPAVAGYGNVQPVPVWLERRAEWRRRA